MCNLHNKESLFWMTHADQRMRLTKNYLELLQRRRKHISARFNTRARSFVFVLYKRFIFNDFTVAQEIRVNCQ